MIRESFHGVVNVETAFPKEEEFDLGANIRDQFKRGVRGNLQNSFMPTSIWEAMKAVESLDKETRELSGRCWMGLFKKLDAKPETHCLIIPQSLRDKLLKIPDELSASIFFSSFVEGYVYSVKKSAYLFESFNDKMSLKKGE